MSEYYSKEEYKTYIVMFEDGSWVDVEATGCTYTRKDNELCHLHFDNQRGDKLLYTKHEAVIAVLESDPEKVKKVGF